VYRVWYSDYIPRPFPPQNSQRITRVWGRRRSPFELTLPSLTSESDSTDFGNPEDALGILALDLDLETGFCICKQRLSMMYISTVYIIVHIYPHSYISKPPDIRDSKPSRGWKSVLTFPGMFPPTFSKIGVNAETWGTNGMVGVSPPRSKLPSCQLIRMKGVAVAPL
jgi:hypothetical protein